MASQQLKRESKNEDPKVTSHFESVSVKEYGDQPTAVVHQVTETIQGASLGAGIHKDKPTTQGTATQQGQHKSASSESMQREQEDEGPSLEEISKYRGTAQQNSMEAIRAAQEQYQKSKDNVSKSSSQQTKNYFDAPQSTAAGRRGGGVSSATARPEDYRLEKSSQMGRTPGLMDVTKKGASYVGEAARTTRDVTMEMGNTAAEYMGKGAGVVRDAAVVGGWNAAEFAAGVTDSVEQVGGQATDVVAGLIDTTVDVSTQGAAVTLETGTTAAQYVEKAGGLLEDVAVVAGWNAAKLASDIAAGAMETMEDVSGQVAAGAIDTTVDMSAKWTSYVGEAGLETGKTTAEYARMGAGALKDVAAKWVDMSKQGASFVGETGKDVTLGAVKTAAECAGKAAGLLKDAAVVAGWNTAEFSSKKATDAIETLEDVSGQAEDVTAGVIDKTVDLAERGVSYVGETAVAGQDLTIETGKKTAEYARKCMGVLKDVAAESLDTTLDMSKQGASFVGETAVVGKDATIGVVKATGKAAGVLKDAAIVAGWDTAEFASYKAADALETMEDVSYQAEDVTAGIIENTVDLSAKGLSYAGETAVAGKDLAIETGKKNAEYARKGAGVLKDVAAKSVDTTLDMSKQGASFVGETAIAAKDVTLGAVKTTAEYAGKAAGVLKDVAVVGGWNTTEFASNKAADAIDTMGDVSSQAEDVTAEIIDRTVDISEKGVNYIGQTAVAGKDLTLQTGKTTAEYARKGAGALKDVASGLMDTTLDMGQKGASYAGQAALAGKDIALGTGKKAAEYVGKNTKETAIDYDARNKAEKEREFKIGGEFGGHRAESRASGGVGSDINNQTRDTTKGANGVTDGGGFEHNQPGGLIVEGHVKQKGPGGVKEQGNFKLQESGGVVEGSLEHRGTGDASGAMRMIGKTLMDVGDNKKDSKVRRGG